jgi:L-lactate dehydrogenase complex protein LldG
VLDLLEDRLADYQAQVTRCSAAEVSVAVGAALRSVVAATGAGPGARRVVVPAGLPHNWVTADDEVTVVVDDGQLSWGELDLMIAVVTAATVAAAVTGTIVLDGSADQGRRAISLVPDVHVCVVTAEQVVHSVPEMLARLDPVRPTTFISGPSATSDIELERVEGVHGPRTLHVVLVC